MASLERAIRDSGILDAIRPADELRQQQAVRRVIDPAGGIAPPAMAPYLAPQVMGWGPASVTRHRVARAGTAVLIAAYAATPPSDGNCMVTVTMVTPLSGEETIGTVQINDGRSTGEEPIAYPVPAGAWIGSTVTTPSGASGVSSSLVIAREG